MFDLKAHLKTLVEAHAPSGHEAPLRNILQEAWQPYTDDMQQDRLGSLIAIKRANVHNDHPARKVMIAAHMDEIGLMVRDIVDGFIYVHDIHGIDNRVMLAQPVIVHGKQALPGIVASVPPHLLSEDVRKKYPGFDDLIVDVGLPAAEVEQLVSIGDLITLDVPLLELLGRKVAAKAMDDRACVAAVTVCLNELQQMQHRWDVYATATAQEESGIYGAKTAAFLIQPDIAIALDVGFARQPGVEQDVAAELGNGPMIGLGPNLHTRLTEKLHEVARYHEIKVHDDILPGHSGTDAWPIQVSQQGIPTALISLPLRNMHSPVETADLRDIERIGRLLAHFIAGLDADFLTNIDWKTDEKKEAQGS